MMCDQIKAVILAGGRGTRLKPLTAVFPKPLVPLGDMPVVEILLRRLAAFGFRDITLCTGYLRELLMAVCRDGSQWGLSISYSHEEMPLGTAGPLRAVDGITNPFIVMNGDLLTTLNFESMLHAHVKEEADITIGVFQRDNKIDFGVVEMDDAGHFTGFKEKPTYHFSVSMGVNILSRQVTELVAPDTYLDMPDLILKVHQSGGKVRCYQEDCFWLDIGRMDDYAAAQDYFAENKRMFLDVEA